MREASTDCLAIASSSICGLKMAFLSKNAIFRPNIELEAIARQPVEASREVICAHFGNIGRNSGYFLLPIFLGSYLIVHPPTIRRQEVEGAVHRPCLAGGAVVKHRRAGLCSEGGAVLTSLQLNERVKGEGAGSAWLLIVRYRWGACCLCRTWRPVSEPCGQ